LLTFLFYDNILTVHEDRREVLDMRLGLKHIICATDFSEPANYAINYGVSLAKEFNAKLYVCHVIDLSSATLYGDATFAFETQLIHMEDYAQDRLKRLMDDIDIEWEPLISTGNAADEVARLASEKGADMAITATRGHSGLKRLILGSVTERLMRTLPCPLLAVHRHEKYTEEPSKEEIRFKRILIGCDFSPDSNLAFEYGLSLAQEYEAELHLIHVLEPPIYKEWPKTPEETREKIRKDLYEQLKMKLEAMVPQDALNWCKPKTMLLSGHPDVEILKYADVQGIDLVVLGVAGHGLVESFFVGSTTERVMRKAPCAVLSVRPIKDNK
jgi:nucleotide-binding universal stress UspA family protein